MDELKKVRIDWATWIRFKHIVKDFAVSEEVGGKAKCLFGALILMLFGINGLNVVNSFVGRDFMTAIENRAMSGFIWWALAYIGVFAVTTALAVYYRFTEESLGLVWRNWLTEKMVINYLDKRNYFRLDTAGEVANPDQRITEDVRALTVTTLSFVLLLLNASFTVVAFTGVMWSISPLLFCVAVLYATGGSFLAIHFGRPLIRLNYDQLDKEANFRADLIHVRENSESAALLHYEGRLTERLLRHLEQLTANFRRIIAVNRNLGFFTTGYNYLIQIIPALIVAPLFIRGEVEFGVITQAAMAFTHLLGAFSLIITQFQSISSYTAVIARLGALAEAINKAEAAVSPIEVCGDCADVVYERLTLFAPRDGRLLVRELSLTVSSGTRLLIVGADETAKVALFRATAGIWDVGTGRIIHPGMDKFLFLPERPYLPPGTLGEVLVQVGKQDEISAGRIQTTLSALGLESVLKRAGGLDEEKDWDDLLSLGEQQLLLFARLLLVAPAFAFLDRPGTTLSRGQVDQILKMLTDNAITYLTLGGTDDNPANYDMLLELVVNGGWQLQSIQTGQVLAENGHA
jgi:putative ATP-binding cassette transporter